MELVDYKTFYILLHIAGAIIGAGGAFVSDFLFFSSVKDRVLSKKEIWSMKIGSRFVWFGLGILFISGALLFLTDPLGYLNSSKFLIKTFIVFIIFLNGIIFHIKHLPLLHRHADNHYPSSDEFNRKKKLLVVSGVISMSSWIFAVILGILSSIPVTFIIALGIYIAVESACIFCAVLFSKRLF